MIATRTYDLRTMGEAAKKALVSPSGTAGACVVASRDSFPSDYARAPGACRAMGEMQFGDHEKERAEARRPRPLLRRSVRLVSEAPTVYENGVVRAESDPSRITVCNTIRVGVDLLSLTWRRGREPTRTVEAILLGGWFLGTSRRDF